MGRARLWSCRKVPAKVPTIGLSVWRWWLRPSSVSPARSSFMASSSAEKPRRRHHLPTRLQVCLAFKTSCSVVIDDSKDGMHFIPLHSFVWQPRLSLAPVKGAARRACLRQVGVWTSIGLCPSLFDIFLGQPQGFREFVCLAIEEKYVWQVQLLAFRQSSLLSVNL